MGITPNLRMISISDKRMVQLLWAMITFLWVLTNTLPGQECLRSQFLISDAPRHLLPGPDTLEFSTYYGDLFREYLGDQRIGTFTTEFSRLALTRSVGSHLLISGIVSTEHWYLQHTAEDAHYSAERNTPQAGFGLQWRSALLKVGGYFRTDTEQRNTSGSIFGTLAIGKVGQIGYRYDAEILRLNGEVAVDTSFFYPNILSRERTHQLSVTLKWHQFSWMNLVHFSGKIPQTTFQPTHHSAIVWTGQSQQFGSKLSYSFSELGMISGFGNYYNAYPDINFLWKEQPLGQFNAQQDTVINVGLAYRRKNSELAISWSRLTNVSRLQSRTYPFTSVWADLVGTFFYGSNDLRLEIMGMKARQLFNLNTHQFGLGVGFLQLDGEMRTSRHTWSLLGSIQNYHSGVIDIDQLQILVLQPQWQTTFYQRFNLSMRLIQFVPVAGSLKSEGFTHEPGRHNKFNYRGGRIGEVSVSYAIGEKASTSAHHEQKR